jgi:NitT/TauT family transport system substrate-binding protein
MIVLLVGLLAACSSAEIPTASAPAPTDEPTAQPAPTAAPTAPMPVIRYANLKVYDPVYVAIDQGFCERRGVKVEIVGDTLGGPTAIQAVAAGYADAGLSSIPALVNANAAGLPVIGVTDIQSALPKQPLEKYFVRADSGISSITDLKGKNFAVNLWKSSFHYTALMALEQNGMGEKDVNFMLLGFGDQAAALDKGDVDVIGLMEPYAAQAQAVYGDKFKELFNAIDIFGEKQFTLHFVNRIWANEHPDTAKAFVGCIVDAIDWIEKNPDAAKPIVGAYTKVDAQFIPEYHFQPGGVVVMEDVQFWLDYMIARKDVTVDWLKVDQIATNDFRP